MAIDPKKVKKASGVQQHALPKIVTDQVNFTRDYLASPKYAERLGKMINTEKKLQGAGNGPLLQTELADYFKTTQPTSEIVSAVIDRNKRALENVAAGKISVGNHNLGKDVAGIYDSSIGDIRLEKDMLNKYSTTPSHELSHAINNSRQPYSKAFEKEYTSKALIPNTDSSFSGYVQAPTEIKARLDAVRYLGAKKGIYNAGEKDFTQEDLDKMKNDKSISEDINFKQLMDQFPDKRKDKSMIWFMNNIAKKKGQSGQPNV